MKPSTALQQLQAFHKHVADLENPGGGTVNRRSFLAALAALLSSVGIRPKTEPIPPEPTPEALGFYTEWDSLCGGITPFGTRRPFYSPTTFSRK